MYVAKSYGIRLGGNGGLACFILALALIEWQSEALMRGKSLFSPFAFRLSDRLEVASVWSIMRWCTPNLFTTLITDCDEANRSPACGVTSVVFAARVVELQL